MAQKKANLAKVTMVLRRPKYPKMAKMDSIQVIKIYSKIKSQDQFLKKIRDRLGQKFRLSLIQHKECIALKLDLFIPSLLVLRTSG